MSKSNCEPALLSSLETLQHNLQDAGMLRMKASLYSEAAVREALGDSEYRRISEKLDRRALLAQLDAVSLFLLQVLGLVSVGEGDGDLLSRSRCNERRGRVSSPLRFLHDPGAKRRYWFRHGDCRALR